MSRTDTDLLVAKARKLPFIRQRFYPEAAVLYEDIEEAVKKHGFKVSETLSLEGNELVKAIAAMRNKVYG